MKKKGFDNKSRPVRERWIQKRYSSRRGFVRTIWHQVLNTLGVYRHYKDIDWSVVDRLVFVCKGNICRSVFAEQVARSLGVNAVSCGLDTIENAPANEDALNAANLKGYDLVQHKTTPVMYLVLKKSDLLVVMEPWQAEYLVDNLARSHQYTLLGSWGGPQMPHIQDPYGASPAYFDRCFSYIQSSVKSLSSELNK